MADHSEVRTTFVDGVSSKGFSGSVPVYRVEQTHRTLVIPDQRVVRTDLRGFIRIRNTTPMATVEKVPPSVWAPEMGTA